MATLKELKGRIGSVASSEKITGAMKMISSAKMHKAMRSLRRLQPFRQQISSIFANILSSDAQFESPLLEVRDVKNCAIVAFGSDDGLCGAYNANIVKALQASVDKLHSTYPDVNIKVIAVGEKLRKAAMKLRNVTVAVAEGVNSKSGGDDVNNFSLSLQKGFIDGEFDRVDLAYMSFKTVGRQRFDMTELLPVSVEALAAESSKSAKFRPYLFEPDPASIFASALPMYLMSVVQDVFVENQASEQAARVMAMQSANDNAKKLLEQLRLEYNKLRQQSITTELLDILGGQVR
ncbi:MAG: ATP synthase F1 subunit gamma [Muribaculaceae bacterium]|nr:ATP synthase F1 subunit gamma [Muribaculaceae bacterium]